jgi:hypothetical protein
MWAQTWPQTVDISKRRHDRKMDAKIGRTLHVQSTQEQFLDRLPQRHPLEFASRGVLDYFRITRVVSLGVIAFASSTRANGMVTICAAVANNLRFHHGQHPSVPPFGIVFVVLAVVDVAQCAESLRS